MLLSAPSFCLAGSVLGFSHALYDKDGDLASPYRDQCHGSGPKHWCHNIVVVVAVPWGPSDDGPTHGFPSSPVCPPLSFVFILFLSLEQKHKLMKLGVGQRFFF